MKKRLSHLNGRGEASMVDVSPKAATARRAVAGCEVLMQAETMKLLRSGKLKKGDAFTVAKIAGIQAAKRTFELIPLCHPLPLEQVEIRILSAPRKLGFFIEAEVRTTAKTGVEMEALTAAATAALTLYDMAKAADPGMVITNLHLIEKRRGKSDYACQSGNHQRQ
jgi:cyclic pyranopterin phosphate synthase